MGNFKLIGVSVSPFGPDNLMNSGIKIQPGLTYQTQYALSRNCPESIVGNARKIILIKNFLSYL